MVEDGTALAAWAKCPECLAFFQLGDATWRVVPAAQIVHDESVMASDDADALAADRQRFTVSSASLATVSDISLGDRSSPADDAANLDGKQPAVASNEREPDVHSEHAGMSALGKEGEGDSQPDPEVVIEGPESDDASHLSMLGEDEIAVISATSDERIALSDTAQDDASRLDNWFRGEAERARLGIAGRMLDVTDANLEPTVDHDAASMIDHPASSATTESEWDSGAAGGSKPDSERKAATLPPDDRPTWDDSEQMDRLLADVETVSADEAGADPMLVERATEVPRQEMDTGAEAAHLAEEHSHVVAPPILVSSGRVPRRRNSALRMVVGTVTSGAVGLALGYYALLWLKGADGDFLNIASQLPSAVLPAGASGTAPSSADRDEQTAEVQASYTTPSTQPDTTAHREDSSTAGEVASAADPESNLRPFDESTALPLADTLPTSGELLDAPVFTADELAVALQTALRAEQNLTAGDLRDSREIQRAKGLSYSLMCDLAQKMAFVDRDSRPEYVQPLLDDAEQLFRRSLSDPHTRDEVAIIVEKWIVSPHRTHGGVFFAGNISHDAEQGTVVECQLNLGGNRSLTVLCPQTESLSQQQPSRPLAVVGWIVDAPAEKIRGYNGSASRAIWASQLIPLD